MATNPFDEEDKKAALAANPFLAADEAAKNPPGLLKRAGSRIADVGLSTLKGAIGVPESIIGVADLVTGGDAGKLAEKAGFRPKEAKAFLDQYYSDEQKAANAEVAQAEGFVPTVGAMLHRPSTILHQAVESAPSMITGGAVARGVMKAVPELATKKGAIAAGAMGEGVVAAGQNAEHVRQEDPNGTLTGKQAAIIALSGGLTGGISLASGRLANELGLGDLTTMVAAGRLGPVGADAIEAGAKKGIMRKIGEGALVEGIGQELPQSYTEQVATNLAQDKPWDEGAAKAGAQGMLAGALLGGISGPLTRNNPATTTTTDTTTPTDPAAPGAPPAAPTGPATPPAPAGPLTQAASLLPTAGANGQKAMLPFSSMDVAQKQADAFTQSSGIPHEAVDHPTVPGRFAARPAGISGADELFVKEAERQGVDAGIAQLAGHGPAAQKLLADVMAAYPDLDPQLWRDPAMRAQLGAAYLKQHIDALGEALGHAPSPAEHYIAQLIGLPAASAMLTMPEAERSMPVSAVIADPELEDRLGVTGMPVDGALDVLTQQAAQLLAKMKEKGNANLATDVSGTQSGAGRSGAGPAVGDTERDSTVPGRPAGRTDALVGAPAAGVGDDGNQPAGAGAIASPRGMVGPTETGYQNVNAQRHRDTADQLGLTAKIEAHFGDGLTVNQVVGQMADLVPHMVPADVPNFVNGVRQTLGIPAPISPEGKGAFDAWRAEYKARLAAPPAAEAAEAPAFKVGDPVQVTLNDTDLFVGGTKITHLSDDGQYAFVDGSDSGVPVSALTSFTSPPTGPTTPAASARPRSTSADLSQEDYAQELEQRGLPEGVSAYDALTANPELRGMTAQERVAMFNEQRAAVDGFRNRVEALWQGHKDAAQDGILPIGATSGWTNFEIGEDTHAKGAERHKSYASIRDFINISEADMSALLLAMRDAGYNGQVKFPGVGARALLGFDNVVMHGATEQDAKLGEAVARQFFGERITGTQFGTDADGKSHTQLLADRVEANIKGAAATPTGPTTSDAGAPSREVVTKGPDDSGKANVDHARLEFVGAASGFEVSKELKAKVQEALRTRQDAYDTSHYAENDTRLHMPKTEHTANPRGGQFHVQDDGRVSLMGDDEYGWASTMSQRSVTRTLTDWLKNMGQAPATTGAATLAAAVPGAPMATSAPARVNYPKRKLGFQNAKTDPQDEYNDHAWANIAAANMKVGDTFELGGKKQTVESITDKTLKIKSADGKTRTLNPNGVAWGQFQRDLGGQLTAENLQANNIMKPKRPLIDIFKRDPAVHVDEKGSVYLKDGGLVDVKQPKADNYDQRVLAAAVAWGYAEAEVPVDQYGHVRSVLPQKETALQYTNGKKGDKNLHFEVNLASAPNGKWGMATSHQTGTKGRHSPISVFGEQYDSRADALDAGVAELRERMRPQDMASLDAAVKALPKAGLPEGTAPEHARNVGKVLDPNTTFEPTIADQSATETAGIDNTIELLTMDAAAFAEITNEFAELFADPGTYVQNDKRVDMSQVLKSPEPIPSGKGEWVITPSKATLAKLKKASWEADKGAPATPVVTMTEVTTAKEKARGDRYFTVVSNYTNLYDSAPITYGALIAGDKAPIKNGRDSGRVGGKDGLATGTAEAKALWLELEVAINTHDGWTDHAIDQAEKSRLRQANSQKVILSLFDLSGVWGQPWADAGYNVIPIDIQNGIDVNDLNSDYLYNEMGIEGDIHGILAATPCTDFANSGAKHFAAKDQDGRTEASKELVFATMKLIEELRPKFWVLENPVGRIERLTGLPPARMSFDQWHFGHAYTKRTMLWGNFNTDMPLAPVDPVLGSKMHSKFGGKSQATKNARSVTADGFAKAFFMANNYADLTPAQRLPGDYPEASGAVRAALKAGVSEERIKELMYETYENYDYRAARDALLKEVAALEKKAAVQDVEQEADEGVPAPEEVKPDMTAQPVDVATSPVMLEGTPEYDALEQRAQVNDKAVDALTSDQVRAMYAAMNLAGASQSVEKLRDIIKAEHPDDVEAGLKAIAPVQDDLAAVLDDELKAALSDLGDILGDVFNTQAKMMGPKRTAGELLPALSKVVDLLIRKGLRSFKQAIGMSARAMRANPATAHYVDQISPRQWKAAYNAVAELHDGADTEAQVGEWSDADIAALISAPTQEQAAAKPEITNDERLMLIACSDAKREGTHPAADLYTGSMYGVLNKWMPKQRPEIYVISAKHGLVQGSTLLAKYDQKMTPERIEELAGQKIDLAQFKGKTYRDVFIAGGADYRRVADAYVQQLKAAGVITSDATVNATQGGIGEQRGQLGQYLRVIGGQAGDDTDSEPTQSGKPGHEQTRKEYRDDVSRGEPGTIAAAKINLNKKTVLTLLAKHKDDIFTIGRLMGAKGGKDIKKVAADIVRLHKLRTMLANETPASLMTRSAVQLKELAKEVGVYAGNPKQALADSIIGWRDEQGEKFADRLQDAKHYQLVRMALRGDKTVSDAVLADYPLMAVNHFARDSEQYKNGINLLAEKLVMPPYVNVPVSISAMREQAAQDTDPRQAEIASDTADAAQRSLDKHLAPKTIPTGEVRAWESTPFADRIKTMLADLRAAGGDSMAQAIEAGSHADAKGGRLNEEGVAFREAKARDTIAKPGLKKMQDAKAAKDIAAEAQPASGAPQHIEGDKVEAATPVVIAAAIKKSANNTVMNNEQARTDLLKHIDAAIAGASAKDKTTNGQDTELHAAKDELDKAEMRKRAGGDAAAVDKAKERLKAARAAADWVVFDVPGDGKFTVRNVLDNLTRFRAQVVSTEGFKGKSSTRPYKVPFAMGPTNTTSINDMLDNGEMVAANAFSKQIGKPFGFGTRQDNPTIVNLYVDTRPADIGLGLDAFVGRSVTSGNQPGYWFVIEKSTSQAIGQPAKTAEAALAASRSRLANEKITAEKIAEAMAKAKAAGGTDQATLEARWLEQAEKSDDAFAKEAAAKSTVYAAERERDEKAQESKAQALKAKEDEAATAKAKLDAPGDFIRQHANAPVVSMTQADVVKVLNVDGADVPALAEFIRTKRPGLSRAVDTAVQALGYTVRWDGKIIKNAPQSLNDINYQGFDREDGKSGDFTLSQGKEFKVAVEKTGADTYQVRHGSAKSVPRMTLQNVIAWTARQFHDTHTAAGSSVDVLGTKVYPVAVGENRWAVQKPEHRDTTKKLGDLLFHTFGEAQSEAVSQAKREGREQKIGQGATPEYRSGIAKMAATVLYDLQNKETLATRDDAEQLRKKMLNIIDAIHASELPRNIGDMLVRDMDYIGAQRKVNQGTPSISESGNAKALRATLQQIVDMAEKAATPAPDYQGPHFAAGKSAHAEGKPRTLPSYFTKPGDKNSKDWYRGWDAGASVFRNSNGRPFATKQQAEQFRVENGLDKTHTVSPTTETINDKYVDGYLVKPRQAKGDTSTTPAKIGDAATMAGVNVVLAQAEEVEGVRYELYNAAKMSDTRGVVRIIDQDTGSVVHMLTYPTYDKAEDAYEKAVDKAVGTMAEEPDSKAAVSVKTPDSLNLLHNPVEYGDTVRFDDGSEWTAKNGYTGGAGAWTLLQGKTEHPTVKGIDGQAAFIAAIIAANETAKSARNDDLRGFAWAIVKDGKIATSGSLPAPQYEAASERTKLDHFTAMADQLGGDLYIGGYPGAASWSAPQGEGQLIMGMTWEQIQARQQGKRIDTAINGKMPKDAVLVHPAEVKAPAIPEGYRKVTSYFKDGKEIDGFAPYAVGDEVRMLDNGAKGVVDGLVGEGPIFRQALIKRDGYYGTLKANWNEIGPPLEAPAWHTEIPETGLPVVNAELAGTGYRTTVSRIAQEAVDAITQVQKMNGERLFAYYLPAGPGVNGRVRLVPNTQKVPAGWKKIEPAVAYNPSMTAPDEIASRLRNVLSGAPIIAGPAVAAPAVPAKVDEPKADTGVMDLAGHEQLMNSARDGDLSLSAFKAGYQLTLASETQLKAEMTAKKKDELLRAGGRMFAYRHKSDTKPEIIKALYNDMLFGFAIGKEGGISYTLGAGFSNYEQAQRAAITKAVNGLTEDDLKEFAAKVAEARAEREQSLAARAEGVADPKTIDDFKDLITDRIQEGMTPKQGRLSLTQEQRARFDALVAEKTRGERGERKQEQRTQVNVAGQTVDGQIIETKHTKKGHDLFVVKLSERVSREDYNTLNASAKRIGGYYSSFRGNGAIAGFQFPTHELADAFVKLAQGDSGAAQEAAVARRDAFDDDKAQSGVERLEEMADRLEQQADDSDGAERKTNTARRARFASAADSVARAQRALATTMRNIAQSIKDGKATFLDRVRQKVQIELLDTLVYGARNAAADYEFPVAKDGKRWNRPDGYDKRLQEPATVADMDHAEWPQYTAFRSDLARLGRQLSNIDGTKLMGQRIMKVADDVTDVYLKFAKENLTKVATFAVTSGERAVFSTVAQAEAVIARSGFRGRAIVLPIKRGENMIVLSPSEALERGIWQGDGDKKITLTPEFGAELVEKLGKNSRLRGIDVPWQFQTAHSRRAVLARMGIETPFELRAALREYMQLKVAPQAADKVKQMERAMVGRRNDGMDFFPTPTEQADEMVAAADIQPGMRVLEPSAGMGHIADRIRAAGFEPDVVEMASDRRELLVAKGYNLVGNDFMDTKPREFFTFGDTFEAPDGKVGIMRGLNRERVDLRDSEGKSLGYYNRDDLTPVKRNGFDTQATTQVARADLVRAEDVARGDALSYVRNALFFYDRGDMEGAAMLVERAQRVTEDGDFQKVSDGLGERLRAAAAGLYDRIIMNPPFSDRRDVEHVMHAYSLLKPGGRLVAIMGEGSFFGQDKTAQGFRDWIDAHDGTSEKLAEGTFLDPSLPVTTSVNARMVVIDKPAVGPLFSRPEQPDANTVMENGKTPISNDDFAAVIDRIQASFAAQAGAALPVTIQPVRQMSDLPLALQDSAARQEVGNSAKGVFHNNVVYVVQQAHSTPKEVETTIFHELYGHAATRTLFGGEWLAKQNALLKAVGGGEGLLRLADANKINLRPYIAGLLADTTLNDDQRRAIMMDELLAHMAEKKTLLRQKINEFIGAVRAWLRSHGFATLAEYGNTDLAYLLRDARRSLMAKAGNTTDTSPPLFSATAPTSWYSTMSRQIGKTATKSASPQHWGQTIMGAGFAQQGVKQDEIQWSGVLDWLLVQAEAGKAKVGKDELLNYLAQNGVRVEEVERGDPTEDDVQMLLDDEAGEGMTREDAVDYLRLGEGATKFEKWQLPGGANYRELLLTLPQKEMLIPDFLVLDNSGHQFGVYKSEADAQRIAADISGTYEAGESIAREPLKFQSGHWHEANVLAHVRFNERTDADGKRVLFVEELQSDWSAAGRRTGFESMARLRADVMAAASQHGFDLVAAEKAFAFIKAGPLGTKERPTGWAWDTLQKAVGDDVDLNRMHDILDDQTGKTNDGPFVGKTEAWLSLAIKRVISYAAQHGYDKVAFINGRQSADRYDLAQQVKQINYVAQADNLFDIAAINNDSQAVLDEYGVPLSRVEALLGKEIAQKIERGEGQKNSGTDGKSWHTLSGVDRKVGGEGMLAFYDQIVPNTVNAVLKKLGGGKAETVDLGGVDKARRHALVRERRDLAENDPRREELASEIDRLARMEAGVMPAMNQQVGFTITDALRDKALGGLPLFSRSPADLSRQAGAVIKAVTWTSVKNKLIDHRDKLLMSLGRRQLKDLYGYLFPQGANPNMMESYNTLAMKMDAEKNEAGAAADALTTRWAKLDDHEALAELMHDSTRLQIDPSKPYVYGDIKKQYTELATRYTALSEKAKAIFQDAARAYEKHYADVRAAVHDRIVRAMPGHPGQAAMLTRMDADFFHKIKGIYFPLSRFGDYLVQVNWRGIGPNPMTGQAREAVHFAETIAEAQELRKALLEKYPANKGYQVAEITRRAEYNAARDSVGRGFLQQMFNLFKTTGMDPSLQDAINQLYLTSLPDLSWAKHGIHRKGTPGFSQDARRAFAHHMFHGARYLAKLHYADQLTQELDDMQHYLTAHAQDAGYEPVKAQQLVDEMVKRHEIYMNPKTNALSTGLTSFGFVFFLGLSPASAMVNLSQTALVAYPILGGRYGYGKAGSALLAASKDAMRGHNDMGQVLTGDELRAYEGWVKSGLIDVTMAHDLAGVSQGEDSKLWGKMRPVMKAASFMFHHAEKFNRQATALAAYRLARGKGMDHEAAYAQAVDDTYAGHFDYAAGNRPRIMQGNVARVVLLFKQYAQNMIYTFSRNAQLAFKGDKQAIKSISGLLVSHALAAGVLGLPLVGTLLAAASLLGSDDDEPWDAKIALRNMMADAFGNDTAEVMAHGLSRATPWDISSRVGLNQLLLPDVQEGLEGGRLAETYMVGLMGPIAGVVVNWGKGLHNIAEGQMQRGLEQMVPVALRGPMKSVRYYQEGVKDRSGIDILPETTAAEEAGQFLGLSPSRAREAQEGKSAIFKTDRALQNRRQDLMTTYAKQVMKQEDPTEALDAIGAFNLLHPNRLIAPLHLMQSIRVRMQHQAQAEQGIFLPAKRRDAREAGRFAEETP